tara:strand:- start:9 stop:263 length:255 start_codon:yes stop_codon:yes gene_type:complete
MALIYNKSGDQLINVPQTNVYTVKSVEMARYDTNIDGSFWDVLELIVRDEEGLPIYTLRMTSDHHQGKQNLERIEVTHRKARIL